MKAYKFEVVVIDLEDYGLKEIELELTENVVGYVLDVKEAEIDEWSDNHPLNRSDTTSEQVRQYFK